MLYSEIRLIIDSKAGAKSYNFSKLHRPNVRPWGVALFWMVKLPKPQGLS